MRALLYSKNHNWSLKLSPGVTVRGEGKEEKKVKPLTKDGVREIGRVRSVSYAT